MSGSICIRFVLSVNRRCSAIVKGKSSMSRYIADHDLLQQHRHTVAPLVPKDGWLGAVEVRGKPFLQICQWSHDWPTTVFKHYNETSKQVLSSCRMLLQLV